MSDGFSGGAASGAAPLSACPGAALAGVRGVLFDLDGTLLDTERLILVSFRHAVETVLGKSIPDERLMAKVGQPLTVQMWDFTDDQVVHDELLGTYRTYNERVHDDLVGIFPGVADALAELRGRGLALGVVTSKRHEAALRGLSVFGLDAGFDFLIGSDDWPAYKPDPGPVVHGCDLLGLQPRECVYVGDSPFDIQAGNGAGCTTVAALWGMFPEAALEAESPDYACRTIDELPKLLGEA
ncbi:HAD family hydrolase [Gordonibacter massiliensis (ex Traore et al. 2017)]|uniref:HAD-IA family hydrolase n=1 Tax=Gordonibacter massiliensis (ex Traore et al. 2017) TaxID=1841863 RepID=A0A842J9D0_9ACTN|nr:HAD-IA family hydrolase [Gordonibacter massiliensis (ex Traore et al. 2017)]MBC2888692.1 HAD-IA family hydrolase [Gordonibacter massiliensis (ex Traore et al. 2017)]